MYHLTLDIPPTRPRCGVIRRYKTGSDFLESLTDSRHADASTCLRWCQLIQRRNPAKVYIECSTLLTINWSGKRARSRPINTGWNDARVCS